MDRKHNYFFPVYMNLEKDVINLSRYILFNDRQMDVYSIFIADLIVRCAIEIEAISKELYWETGGEIVYDKNGKERDLYFDTDCINHLNTVWGICEKEIAVSCDSFYFEAEENTIIRPLHKANIRGKSIWNKAYQAVKHDRRSSINRANIRNLIHALGALYVLNLYYLDKNFDLGTTNNPMSVFDSSMGSSIFSALTLDATINIKMGAEHDEDIISEEIKDRQPSAIYILRYKKEHWERINNAIKEDKDIMIQSILQSEEVHNYIQNNKKASGDNQDIGILEIAYKVLGQDFYKNFAKELNNGQKEAVLNKGEPIY